ncbi:MULTISPECIES: AAA family ATPase [unclassified Colwellia]|uniref:AAA family ATPase n=1 Tax=unclassified Colwellia TaxID=196834 RepID=UPI001C70B0A4|nr:MULTISPECIES: AAA family ATPase [unclassified Colwellia]
MIDLKQARTFIEFLHDDANKPVCFQVFWDDKTKGAIDTLNKPKTFHAPLEDCVDYFNAMQDHNYGIYVTLNKTDGRGREEQNIIGYSILFADFDNTALPDFPLQPHFITQRDATHSHCYWRVNGLVTDDQFKKYQKQLAMYLGSDEQVFDTTRVVRLAGSCNMKNPANPAMYNIVSVSDREPFTTIQIDEAFPLTGDKLAKLTQWVDNSHALETGEGFNDDPINREKMISWLGRAEPAVEGSGTYTLVKVASMGLDLGIPLEECKEIMWEHYDHRCIPTWRETGEQRGFNDCIERAYKYAKNAVGCRTAVGVFSAYRAENPLPEPTGGWEENALLRKIKKEPTKNGIGGLDQFVLNGSSQKMKKQMLEDTYLLDGLAILGQLTVFYAAPNTGKTLITLKLLMEAVESPKINRDNIFYINADDNYNGLVTKLSILEKHNIKMLVPDMVKSDYDDAQKVDQNIKRFKTSELTLHIEDMIENHNAKGMCIILDTLKKFTDIMDKKGSSEFGKILRRFSASGGSVIALAHVNKASDANGKRVHGGTTDILDDFDCSFIIEELSNSGDTKSVIFENNKARGNVRKEVCFSYSTEEGIGYEQLLNSVTKIENPNKKSVLNKYTKLIASVHNYIHEGINKKTELINQIHSKFKPQFSKSKITEIMESNESKEWNVTVGEKNTNTYHSLQPKPPVPINIIDGCIKN